MIKLLSEIIRKFDVVNQTNQQIIKLENELIKCFENIQDINEVDSKGENILFLAVRNYDLAPKVFEKIIDILIKNDSFNINHLNINEKSALWILLESHIEDGISLQPLKKLIKREDLEIFQVHGMQNTFKLIGNAFLQYEPDDLIKGILEHPKFNYKEFDKWKTYTILHEWCTIDSYKNINMQTLELAFDCIAKKTDFDIHFKPSEQDHAHIIHQAISVGNNAILSLLVKKYSTDFVWLHKEKVNDEYFNTAMMVVCSCREKEEKIEILMELANRYPELLKETFRQKRYYDFISIKCPDDEQFKEKIKLISLNNELKEELKITKSSSQKLKI